jgi:hypothetical protein
MKLNPNNPYVFNMTGHEYVTEGAPEVGNDEFWLKRYREQRKDRLTDVVHDYLDDKDTSILEFYNDLREIIVEMNNHHKSFADKAAGALLLLHGKPSKENVVSPPEAENG